MGLICFSKKRQRSQTVRETSRFWNAEQQIQSSPLKLPSDPVTLTFLTLFYRKSGSTAWLDQDQAAA